MFVLIFFFVSSCQTTIRNKAESLSLHTKSCVNTSSTMPLNSDIDDTNNRISLPTSLLWILSSLTRLHYIEVTFLRYVYMIEILTQNPLCGTQTVAQLRQIYCIPLDTFLRRVGKSTDFSDCIRTIHFYKLFIKKNALKSVHPLELSHIRHTYAQIFFLYNS